MHVSWPCLHLNLKYSWDWLQPQTTIHWEIFYPPKWKYCSAALFFGINSLTGIHFITIDIPFYLFMMNRRTWSSFVFWANNERLCQTGDENCINAHFYFNLHFKEEFLLYSHAIRYPNRNQYSASLSTRNMYLPVYIRCPNTVNANKERFFSFYFRSNSNAELQISSRI